MQSKDGQGCVLWITMVLFILLLAVNVNCKKMQSVSSSFSSMTYSEKSSSSSASAKSQLSDDHKFSSYSKSETMPSSYHDMIKSKKSSSSKSSPSSSKENSQESFPTLSEQNLDDYKPRKTTQRIRTADSYSDFSESTSLLAQRDTKKITNQQRKKFKPLLRKRAFKKKKLKKFEGVTLYYNDYNPGVRAVDLLMAFLDMDVKKVHINNVQSKKAFKVNPQGILPTLDDNGFVLVDSQSILTYIVSKLSGWPMKTLYPKRIKTRALIESRFQYFNAHLIPLGKHIVEKILNTGLKSINVNDIEMIKRHLSQVNHMLMERHWIAGNRISVADFLYVSLLSTWKVMKAMPDMKGYPHLLNWIYKCEGVMIGYHKVMDPAINALKAQWKSRMDSNQMQSMNSFNKVGKPIVQSVNATDTFTHGTSNINVMSTTQ